MHSISELDKEQRFEANRREFEQLLDETESLEQDTVPRKSQQVMQLGQMLNTKDRQTIHAFDEHVLPIWDSDRTDPQDPQPHIVDQNAPKPRPTELAQYVKMLPAYPQCQADKLQKYLDCFSQIQSDDCRGYQANFQKFVAHVQGSISQVLDDKGAFESLL